MKTPKGRDYQLGLLLMELKTRILASTYPSEGGVSILADRFIHKINFMLHISLPIMHLIL